MCCGNNIVDFLIFHDIYYVENIMNMKENRDNIYIYIWEELNTVYIGRTVNPKGRHYQHKHRESEKTYQFSSENHVEHPKMTILENDLSLDCYQNRVKLIRQAVRWKKKIPTLMIKLSRMYKERTGEEFDYSHDIDFYYSAG